MAPLRRVPSVSDVAAATEHEGWSSLDWFACGSGADTSERDDSVSGGGSGGAAAVLLPASQLVRAAIDTYDLSSNPVLRAYAAGHAGEMPPADTG